MSRSRRKPFSPEPIDVHITGMTHEGRGITRVDDKIMFVFGALPDEKVRVKRIQSHSKYDEATVLEVLEASPNRIKAACEHFGTCGGCQLQHLSPLEQIQYKQGLLRDQLHHHQIKPNAWLEPLTCDAIGYRQKARLAVRYVHKKEALLIGFREQKNSKIAIIESCATLDPRVGLKIQALRDLINNLQGREAIAQIEVAIGGSEVALVFRHLAPLCETDLQQLVNFCRDNHFSCFLQPQGAESVHKIYPENTSELLSYTLAAQQLTFQFHPLDFTQVNAQMNQKMINQALHLLDLQPSDTVLDLFCGLGNFSLPIAQKTKEVVGVEGSALMVKRAQMNAHNNGLTNAAFYEFDLTSDTALSPWANRQYDKIVLDPPRSGALEIVEKIERWNSKTILYVSCNPATFVRDANILVHQKGYTLEKVGVMDMFPQTAHIEVMGLFRW